MAPNDVGTITNSDISLCVYLTTIYQLRNFYGVEL